MGKIRQRIEELNRELIDLRRDFHRHPELGFQEHRTAGVVETYLKGLGIATERVSSTGVVGLLAGTRPGPVLMLRADMDALPVAEENDLPYKSINAGISHACGHDAHMAMLLVAAKVLSEHRDALTGSIKFVFQPDEEVAGAIRMIKDGVLENPRVDAAIGMHIWTPLESGKISITAGAVMSSLEVFKVTIHGKGGHTGSPESAVDPILAAANLIQTVQLVQTREINHLKSTIIMFGKIHGGTKSNIIPDTVELEGSIRFLYAGGPESAEQPVERFKRIVRGVCETHRCTCEIEIQTENIPLVNDDGMVRRAKATAKKVFREDEIIESQYLASEDFAFFAAKVPAVFMFLGCGDEGKKTTYPHHSCHFNIDESTLHLGVEMYIRTAIDFFNCVE
ncbi:M20 metallopeptidase family protein [Geopsychrobacter electrodiphilus]|uniref:M20 metallopeptidase family protein n=1 Tax=Geopsychrobacter electrodiphilus TaxID=225196 RepID=UPI00037F894C|nr:amidohydrolase [Geopsychrobacter electrodiphilus]